MSTGSFVSAARAGKMTNWAIARPPGQTQALRPVIALHGLGGSASAVMDGGVEQGLAQAVNAGLPPFAVVSVDGGSSYWHQRASGEDAGAMVLNELIPLLDTQRLDTSRVAFLGWSMGGYGALLLGSRLGPARTAAICAVSPALWLSAGSVAPGSFDGPDDWSANSVFGLPALGSIPIRVDCGNSDPFYAATKQFVAQLPHPPAGGFSPGGHNGGFWSAQLPAELTWFAPLPTAGRASGVEPVSNGIGSDAFSIVWDGQKLHGLNASGRSPSAWTPEYFGGNAVPVLGWNSVTVPGAVSAWVELHARFGRLPFETLFEPAISYGRNGFLVSPTVAAQWAAQVPLFASQPGFADAFMPGGRAPKPGELFTFPDHAATLEKIAATNGEEFYRGELAAKLEAHSAANGGVMRADDLAAHRVDWVDTITGTYRGYTIHQIPPNGQGIVALIALGILEHFDMSSWSVDSAESVHVQIEALKLAFADAQACVADIDYMPVHPKRLLDKEYLRQRATLIDPKRAMPAATGIPRGGTVYLAAADAAGMMVSMIQSNYLGFGSGVVVPGTGISLHNRGSDFTVVPRHPNRVGPRKRPYHTIIPGFVTRDGAPVMSFGVMGGMMQPQGHVQVLVRIADYGQNPQAACDGPRFCWVNGMRVSFENGFPDSTLDELRQRGHDLVAVADYSQFGSCQAIWRLDDGYLAASDPRRDGQAAAC